MPPGNPSPKLAITIAADVHEQVLAAVSRSPRQAQLRRLLRGCEVLALAAGARLVIIDA